MSDNLVKDYLEEIGVISPDQYLDYVMLNGDQWDIYQLSDNILTYVRYELTGKIGYAFCAEITCTRLAIDFESCYYVKSYGNEVKEEWKCEQIIKDQLVTNAIVIIKPY